MAEDQDGKTTFSLTNSSKEYFNAEQTTKLLQAGRGHQAIRKADNCLQKQVGKNVKDEKGDKGGGEGAPSREGNLKKRGFQTPGNTLPAESVASLGNTEGNITGRKN